MKKIIPFRNQKKPSELPTELSSQPQLLLIKENRKMYEDEVHVNTKASKSQNNNVESRASEQSFTDDNVGTITKTFGTSWQGNNDTKDTGTIQTKQSQDQSSEITNDSAVSIPNAVKSTQITPTYSKISEDLVEKIKSQSQYLSIPFFTIPEISLAKSRGGENVELPLNLGNFSTDKGWEVIRRNLKDLKMSCLNNNTRDISEQIQHAVHGYRQDCGQWSNFKMLDRPDILSMLVTNIPFIVDQALQLPSLLSRPIPLLLARESKTIYLTRRLCCSLLANAFFCTYPEPKANNMPDFNFFRLYNDTQSQRCEVKKEKIKCILDYFLQMEFSLKNAKFPDQIISFERRHNSKHVSWDTVGDQLCDVKVDVHGKIEEADRMLQVDFANRLVGGGVLNDGSVMEEIRFCISPELLVSRLFTQALNDDEVLVVTGTEIFTQYTGYSTSFAFNDRAQIKYGEQPTDGLGRTYTQVVAMDASSFKRNEVAKQFQKSGIDRELHKAHVAFMHGKSTVSPVATGNWGCGAFNGNPELKFLIQWMAASHQKRPSIHYHTIGDERQAQSIKDISSAIKETGMTIGDVYKSIMHFSREAGYNNGSLFAYINSYVSGRNEKKLRQVC